MSSFQIKGRLHVKGNTQVVSDKFTKRELVIATTDQYPQFISLQLTQDKVALLDPVNVGDEVTVDFNLQGREWVAPDGTVKYFNTLQAWKVEVGQRVAQPGAAHVPDNVDNTPDDLPF